LLWQWGHVALQGQYLLIGALALYLFSLKTAAWHGLAAAWIAYLVLAYLTNAYLFAMVGTIWLCVLIQRRLNRLATARELLRTGALTLAVVTGVVVLAGQFGAGSGLPFFEYGLASMNLLSPLMPQDSGLLPGSGGVIVANGFQYEGFNYLGLGLLLGSVLVVPAEVRWLRKNFQHHVALLVAFAVFTAFAVSHRVFAGHWLLFELPIPHYVNRIFGIFRGSGRFFWPIAYAQLAIVIVLGFRHARPAIVLCLAAAAILELIDVQPLREKITASIAVGPGSAELDRGRVGQLITRARHVEVVPSFQCSEDRHLQLANMELMLDTARADVPTNTVYIARQTYGLSLLEVLRAPSRRDVYCSA
jgi:hypothetical protein